jgi:hypothetical protein
MRTLSVFVFVAAVAGASVNALTQRGDNQRTAVNGSENQLTLQNVRSHFGKLWTLFSDSKIMTQPLYVSKLIVPAADAVSAAAQAQCPAGCNVVIFGSMKGTVLCLPGGSEAHNPERHAGLGTVSRPSTEWRWRYRHVGD